MRPLRRILPLIFPLIAFAMQGCTVIGGVVGSARPDGPTRTRIVPRDEVAIVSRGTLVFATIPERETLRGRFREISDSAGKERMRLECEGGVVSIPLDSITELVEDLPPRTHIMEGLLIGAAIDLTLAAGAYWIYQETQKHIVY